MQALLNAASSAAVNPFEASMLTLTSNGRFDQTRRATRRRLDALRQRHWYRRWAGTPTRGAVELHAPVEADWAAYDAPTFLRRGIVIDGLPDWRQASVRA
jgi:hypothetical protein